MAFGLSRIFQNMELNYEQPCEITISPVGKEQSFYQPDKISEDSSEFIMRQQRKRHRSPRNDKRDRRNSRTPKRNLEDSPKTESDFLQNGGETYVTRSENCRETLTDAGCEYVAREHQQRLSWNLCHRCRRLQETGETKTPTTGKQCKVFSNVLKLKMVRHIGQLLMLLLFASCAAIIATTLLTDVNDRYAAQLLNSDNHQLDEVRLRSVSLKDFRRQLSETRSYYDLLRIFFDRKSISDKEIDELLMAKTLKRISGHVHLREISMSQDYSEEVYYDYGDYALQDPGSSVMEDTHRAYAHFEEMENSPLGYCHHPQPEIVPVRGEGDSKHKLYIPECTVLHRCRNVSGCCPNSSTTCGPKTLEVITKSFFVVELTAPDQVQPSNIQMVENLDFINHTECECKEIKGLPGCDQECPIPFTRTRPDMKCVCDCLEDNESCLEIKRGRRSLDEETLMRIKDKTYMAPECEEEVFDIKTGYCPWVHIRHEHRHYGHRNYQHKDRNHRNQHGRNHRRKNHRERHKRSS